MGSTSLRHLVAAACLTGSVAALGGCAPTGPPSIQAPGPSGVRIASIAVDTTPLLAQSGDPTASWAQQALSAAFAQVLAADMAPGDPTARTLTVKVNSIVLGPVGPDGGATDWIRGTASLGGAPVRVRATAFYTPLSVDQTLWEQALKGRVQTLAQAYAVTVKARLGL